MKWAMVFVLALIAVMPLSTHGQTSGARSCPIGGSTTEPECAIEEGLANNQDLGTVTTANHCEYEVCADRALDDRASWNGMTARALLPAIQGGDIVPRVKAMFTSSAFYHGDYILMMACEDVRWQKDPCFLLWKVWPSREGQIGSYYNYAGRDRDKCWGINGDKKYYTRAEFYDGNGQPGPVIESDDLKYPRACSR